MIMRNGCEALDMATWSRRKHYALYQDCPSPYLSLTTRLDITRAYDRVRRRGHKFFHALLYLSSLAMNAQENFRYRITPDGRPVLCHRVDPSFTVLDKNTELFYFALAESQPDFQAFCAGAEQASRAALAQEYLANEHLDLFYVSAVPWTDFTELTHPLLMSPTDSIPRVCFGRYTEGPTGLTMAVSCLAHHGLADALHLARFFEYMQDKLDKY